MNYRSLLILFLLLLGIVPARTLNRKLMSLIRPRESLFRLLVYMVSALVFVFIYTFAIVWFIGYLFPPAIK
jgi:hypothetical protein